VQCNRYHGDHVLLLGDAAHSTGGTLGQGANSALVDVVRFDEALDETGGDVSAALTSFSERAVPEGQALFDLLQLPPQGPLGLLYLATQFIRGVLSRVLPWVTPPTQQRLSQSLVPYSDIRRKVLFWVKWALRTKRVTSLPL
jgi:kynurenine 3-monooxygenase